MDAIRKIIEAVGSSARYARLGVALARYVAAMLESMVQAHKSHGRELLESLDAIQKNKPDPAPPPAATQVPIDPAVRGEG